jgi:hypothetical protein
MYLRNWTVCNTVSVLSISSWYKSLQNCNIHGAPFSSQIWMSLKYHKHVDNIRRHGAVWCSDVSAGIPQTCGTGAVGRATDVVMHTSVWGIRVTHRYQCLVHEGSVGIDMTRRPVALAITHGLFDDSLQVLTLIRHFRIHVSLAVWCFAPNSDQ